ncbi:MAG TPA: hypothetical protein VND97_01765 [Beijerinckiaceae bacterium]|nr:hypothetical protein [Beijerinckiaceae bacterium]
MSDHWNLENLRLELNNLQAGQDFAIAREVFADLFPPGAHDGEAMRRCSQLAADCGCTVVNEQEIPEVIFRRA